MPSRDIRTRRAEATRDQALLRLRNVGFYMELWQEYPLGFVPQYIAARWLGVSTQRVGQLLKDGKIRSEIVLPFGDERDRLVVVKDLIHAPARTFAGLTEVEQARVLNRNSRPFRQK